MKSLLTSALVLFSFSLAFGASKKPGMTSDVVPKALKNIGIFENLGKNIDQGLEFTDQTGQKVKLEKFFQSKKPVMLSLIYFGCPNLCSYYLNGLVDGLKDLKWTAGEEFEFVVISIDSKEDSKLANAKMKTYMEEYARGEKLNWHFLTGTEEQIKKIANQVGFRFRWDEETKQWAHSTAAIMVTPDGTISRYLHGIMFNQQTLRLGLLEASQGRIGNLMDKVLLFCFQYDPGARKYSLYAMNVMRAGAGVTLVVLAFMFLPFWRRQRRKIHPGDS
jgi:protein SCO1